LFCFCFALLFWFSFLLGFKVFVCFPLYLFSFKGLLFSSHVAKLSSFDPFQAFSSLEDRCKDHLVDGGSACLIKRKIVDKISKSGQVWRGPAKWSLWMSPAGSDIDA